MDKSTHITSTNGLHLHWEDKEGKSKLRDVGPWKQINKTDAEWHMRAGGIFF